MKALRTLLLALTVIMGGSISASAETVTWLASAGNSLSSPIAVDQNITLTWVEGGGDQAPSYSNGAVYFYNGNRVTVKAANDMKLTKIVFTFSNETVSLVTCDASGKNESSTGISTDRSAQTCTWQGEATQLIFRASKQTGARYIKSIEITYQDSSAPVVKTPELTLSATPNSSADLDNSPSVFATYKNTGNGDAENAVLTLWVDGKANRTEQLGTISANSSNQYKSVYYDASTIDAGTYDVYLTLEADGAETVKTEAVSVTFTKKAPEASFSLTAQNVTVAYDATSYNVVAQVTNTSTVDAKGVSVELWSGVNTIASTTIDVAAGQTATATLTVSGGPFEAGEKEMQVVVGGKTAKWITVTVEEAPVAPVYDLAVTAISGSVDLALESNYLTVSVQNNGNQDITDAAVTLTANGKTLGTATVSARAAATGFCTVNIDQTGLEPGTLSVTATVTVSGDATPSDNSLSQDITVKAAPLPEATYSVSAEDVSVPFGAESFAISATVKNTSDVDAKDVEVKLLKGITAVDTKTISALAAGAEQTVTFTVTEMGEAGRQATYFVQVANKAQAEVTVSFEEEPVTEVRDLAVIEVLGTIDLAQESNQVRVTVQNNGNTDITDAAVTLSTGDQTLGTATVSARAGQQGWTMVTVATKELAEGELPVMATVSVEGDATPADNTLEAIVIVKAAPLPEPTFAVTAQDVEVAYGAKSFNIVAVVENTSDVDAKDVEVRLLSGIDVAGTQTIATLAAGAKQTVTFQVQNTFQGGTTKSYYVQVAGQAQAELTVTFEPEPVAEVRDLAITTVSGAIYLDAESNYITVFVENHGTVDISDAPVVITVTGGQQLGSATVSARAGQSGFCSVPVSTDGLQVGDLDITATVTVSGDATPADNVMQKTVNVTVSTAITTVSALKASGKQAYTLGGQKVTTLRPGLYIVDGRKVVVK